MKFISRSEKQTFDFAKNFSKSLRGGEIIGLVGNLGAGKTVFTKGLAAGLGVKKNISSPTFVLLHPYPVKSRSIKQLVHIDAYRVKSARDLAAIGAEEYFRQSDTVTVIEWADKIKRSLPKNTKYFNITINGTSRIFNY